MRNMIPIRLVHIWDRLLTSLWFVPTMMALAALLLAGGIPAVDARVDMAEVLPWDVFTASSVEGARAVLSTIAGSMITVAGVVFSVTIVAITLASSQFGPRLLRNFMRDTANQVVLGSFIATFLYCMVLLKTVREGEAGTFVPRVSLLTALAMAGCCIGLLIYFIHHIATSIQAEQVVTRVMGELRATLDRLYPKADEEGQSDGIDGAFPGEIDGEMLPVRACRDGYVQRIDFDEVMPELKEQDLYVEVLVRPGEFHLREGILARVGPAGRVPENLGERLAGEFVQGSTRTPVQDVTFSFSQIVEVGVRALSPGINDPTTAMHCIDQLTAALGDCARRRLPGRDLPDDGGQARIRTRPVSFAELVRLSTRQIHHYGRDNPGVVAHLLEALGRLAMVLRSRAQKDAVREEVEWIAEAVRAGNLTDANRRELEEVIRGVTHRLTDGSLTPPSRRDANSSCLQHGS